MDNFAYLGMSRPRRMAYKTKEWFFGIPKRTKNFFKNLPAKTASFRRKIAEPFVTLYDALVYGDWKTRLSFLFMGFGMVAHKQIVKGLLYFAFEIIFALFFALWGRKYLSLFGSLGDTARQDIMDPITGIPTVIEGDNSTLILLYGTVCLVVILGFAYTYYSSVKQCFNLQQIYNVNGKIKGFKDDLKALADRQYHKTLMSVPMLGLVLFTIIPLIFMIFVAFTNWDKQHLAPAQLFDWVGFANFDALLGGGGGGLAENAKFAYTFSDALLWTLVWAVFATFSNYFLGMLVAILINKKGIKFKKLWRTFLVTTIAVPQFVSLMLISQMFGSDSIFNGVLEALGLVTADNPLTYSNNALWARIFVIIINVWVGVPYTVLSCTGILMNIPNDLYESAKIDGASPFRMYTNITLPYMMFVMGPSLISSFVGNINNFNVIFLLTGGVPINTDKFIAGDTDLLVTWLYKLTVNENNYKFASVIGIVVFVIVALISLIFYSKSKAVKNEEDFQ